MSISRRAVSGTAIGFVSMVFTMGQAIFLVPVLLHFWGKEEYGVWLTVVAAGTMLTTLDTGHQSYIGNLFNLKFPEVGSAGLRPAIGDGLQVALLLGGLQALMAVLCVVLGLSVDLFGLEESDSIFHPVNIAFIIFVIKWWLTGSIGGVLVRLYTTKGDFTRAQFIGLWSRFLQFVVIIASAWIGLGVLGTMIAFALTLSAISLIIFHDLRIRYPEFVPWFADGSFRRGLVNLKKSSIITLNNVFKQLSSNGLVVIISTLLTATFVPAFTTVRTITNIFAQATQVFLTPLYPDFARFHIRNEHSKLLGCYRLNWLFSGTLINIGIVCSIPLAELLFNMWTRGKIPFSWEMYLLLASSVSLLNFGAPMIAYINSTNQLRAISVLAVVRGVMISVGAVVFINYYGIVGAAVAIFASEVLCAMVLPLYLCRECWSKGGQPFMAGAWIPLIGSSVVLTSAFFAFNFPEKLWEISSVAVFSLVCVTLIELYFLPRHLMGRLISIVTTLKLKLL